MAIQNPAESTDYCNNTGGARLEYQTPIRNVSPADYPWTGHTFTTVPIRYTITRSPGSLLDTLTLSPGGSDTSVTLVANTNYLLTVSGSIDDDEFIVDGLYSFKVSTGRTTPSNRLTTNDDTFGNLFFEASSTGVTDYSESHVYTLDFVGSGNPLTFNLTGSGTGSLNIAVYESSYRLKVTNSNDTETYLDITRNEPFYGLNIACGGDCPTRTSYSCQCGATVSCYWDNQSGALQKIFKADR